MISHGHLDHVAGLLIASPDDNKKPIYTIPHKEVAYFHSLVNNKQQFQDMQVIISHIKYSLKSGIAPRQKILQELQKGNPLDFKFVLAEQGQRLIL